MWDRFLKMTINGADYKKMVVSAANALENEKERINKLNVFPVPDGDTGANMSQTMSSVKEGLKSFSGSISDCAEKVASLLLRAARGNSGVILSIFFRGMAKELKGQEEIDSPQIAEAFKTGADEAYKAIVDPKEGTMLTVMRECGEKAKVESEKFKGNVEGMLSYISNVASETLAKTPEMLPVLKQANVVDAGGSGFVEVINGMLAALKNNPVESKHADTDKPSDAADFSSFNTEAITFPYCTECIVEKSEEFRHENSAGEFMKFITSCGDSAVFVEDEEIIKVHVHTSDPGAVISEAIKYGSLFTVKIENMRLQHTELAKQAEAEEAVESEIVEEEENEDELPPITKRYGFIAVANGKGVRETFFSLGVDTVVVGGQTMNPSTENMIDAINRTPAENVFIFPNNKNIYLVAKQAAEQEERKSVFVIPTVSVPQGITAMIAYNPDAEPEENIEAITEAIKTVKTFTVTYAARSSSFDGHKIKRGQTLGLVENKVKYITDSHEECILSMLPHMEDNEYITIYYGKGVKQEDAEHIVELMREKLGNDKDIILINGGQPVYRYIISAE